MKCEGAINHFAQKDLKFKAIKQFWPFIRETVKILEEPYAVTKLLQRPKCMFMKEKLNMWSKKVVKRTDIAQKMIDR